jgi:very-short-patch-repair endonuclease
MPKLADMSVPVARKLRKRLTDAERRIWSRLRLRQLNGVKFRRQAPVGPYVVDFVCFDRKLVIEVDGGQHAVMTPQERERTAWLESEGFHIIRVWNNNALQNTDGVVEHILRYLALPHPPP